MIKVTFDSNVWENLVDRAKLMASADADVYEKIVIAIRDRKIIPFLSETIFTMEVIRRGERKEFIKECADAANPKISIEATEKGIHFHIQFGPNPDVHPGNHAILRRLLDQAMKMGFNILSFPRISGFLNSEFEPLLYNHTLSDEAQEKYIQRLDEVSNCILALGAGEYDIQQIGLKYDATGWFSGVGKAPDSESNKIDDAVAEWADGDSVSGHIAIEADYFCTNDQAKTAGSRSVMSNKNVQILHDKFGFERVSPRKLVDILKSR